MYELVQRVHAVPPGFDPTQLGLSNGAEPSTHDLLRKCLVPMCRVVPVRSYNGPHITRGERVSHAVCVPKVSPQVRGVVGPNPAELTTWCAHARAAVASQATPTPHAVPDSGSHA